MNEKVPAGWSGLSWYRKRACGCLAFVSARTDGMGPVLWDIIGCDVHADIRDCEARDILTAALAADAATPQART